MRRAYHFLPAKWAIDVLSNRRLKISTFSDLNDPFEFLNCEMSNKDFKKAIDETRKEMYREVGVICFSKDWSNPLLWSHYADKHKGICLGFEFSDNEPKLSEVFYIRNKQALCDELVKAVNRGNGGKEEQIMRKLLLSKYEGWSYEDEVRMFAKLDEEDKDKDSDGNYNYYGGFSKDIALKQVIIGVRCDKKAEDIKNIEGHNCVEIIKARLDFETFRVVENQEVS